MKRWLLLLLCVPGVCAFFFDPSWWLDSRSKALTFLAILLGAVLFRLGRGLPQLTVERLGSSEIELIAEAFKVVGSHLVWVFCITVLAILCLILTEPFLILGHDSWAVRLATSTTLVLSTMALERTVAVVRGDRDLIRLQADLVKRDAWKRNAGESAKSLDKAEREKPMTPADGYGGLRETT